MIHIYYKIPVRKIIEIYNAYLSSLWLILSSFLEFELTARNVAGTFGNMVFDTIH